MAQIRDSFAQRLLLRASLRRKAGVQRSNEQALQRRHNILKAINVQSAVCFKEIHCDANNNESSCVARRKSSETLVLSDDSEGHAPVMESTRKVPHSESTKILYSSSSQVTSTISTIAMFLEATSLDQSCDDAEEIVAPALHATVTYDENNFLVDALGDELNNTSVTYDDSAWQKSQSDFDASDLMSQNDFSVEEMSVLEAIALPMSGLQPRSSSTLNRSMKIHHSAWKEIVMPSSERLSRLGAFLRLLRRLLRGVKNFIGLNDTSKR